MGTHNHMMRVVDPDDLDDLDENDLDGLDGQYPDREDGPEGTDDDDDDGEDDLPSNAKTWLPSMAKTWLALAASYPLLSRDDERALAVRKEKDVRGLKARPPSHAGGCSRCRDVGEAFVMHNLRLIIAMTDRYNVRQITTTAAVAPVDLWQSGVEALMIAAERFDVRRGNGFATYATWWLRQQVARVARDEGAMIREPERIHMLRTKLLRLIREHPEWGKAQLRREMDRYAVTTTGVDLLSDETWVAIQPGRQRTAIPLSLDAPITLNRHMGAEADMTWVEILHANPDDPDSNPDARIEQGAIGGIGSGHDTVGRIFAAVGEAHMPDRWQLVIRLRYGLDGDSPKSLNEIGALLHRSRERVRQIEAKGLDRLRAYILAHEPELARAHGILDGERTRILPKPKLARPNRDPRRPGGPADPARLTALKALKTQQGQREAKQEVTARRTASPRMVSSQTDSHEDSRDPSQTPVHPVIAPETAKARDDRAVSLLRNHHEAQEQPEHASLNHQPTRSATRSNETTDPVAPPPLSEAVVGENYTLASTTSTSVSAAVASLGTSSERKYNTTGPVTSKTSESGVGTDHTQPARARAS